MIQYPQMPMQQQQVQPQSQQAAPGASAVNIQIFSPQAYGSQPNAAAQSAGQQLDNQYYNYPQNSLYQPGGANYAYPMPQAPQPNVQVPSPEVMPNPVLQDSKPQEAEQKPAQQQPVESQNTAQNAPEVAQNAIDTAGIVSALQSQDLNAQTNAITQVAQLSQSTPDVALQVVDNQVMNALIDIIKKDTSSLEGPNQKQIEISQKVDKGEQLTPEEQQIAEQSTPKEIAEKNKVFAMFTLAMLQKLQRDEVDNYNTQTPNNQISQTSIQELPGFNEIVDEIKKSDIGAVKKAGIEALSYLAKPEEGAALNELLTGLASDQNPEVAQAANEALQKLASPQAEAQKQVEQPKA